MSRYVRVLGPSIKDDTLQGPEMLAECNYLCMGVGEGGGERVTPKEVTYERRWCYVTTLTHGMGLFKFLN